MNTWILIYFAISFPNGPGAANIATAHIDTFASEAACQDAVRMLGQMIAIGKRIEIDAACVKA